MKDSFTNYKRAIKATYDEIKFGGYANFLAHPTSARLRDLCIMVLRDQKCDNDHKIFNRFFGFEFDANNTRKIKADTEKFKPLATFLRGETELADSDSADLIAVIINFQPRPYSHFLKSDTNKLITNKDLLEEKGSLEIDANSKHQPELTEYHTPQTEVIKIYSGKFEKFVVVGMLLLCTFLVGFIVQQSYFPKKECMQWNSNRYEIVDCDVKGIWQKNDVEPYDEAKAKLKKIEVNKETEFFRNEIPQVWYIRKDGECEFYNQGGVHPITGKALRPITAYMIAKHVK